MSFTSDWSAAVPIDHLKFKDTPGKIRDVRTDLGERLADIVYGFTAGETDVYLGLKKGRLITIGTAAPSTPPGTGAAMSIDVYARANGTDAGVELYAIDANGVETQLTDDGKQSFKTGDWILSTVTTARTGWTNVSATYSNKFMRINATPLTTGGADTHTTPSHTLTTAEIPAHVHTVTNSTGYENASAAYYGGTSGLSTFNSGSAGGGGGHTHDAADNVPAYVQVVVFQKD